MTRAPAWFVSTPLLVIVLLLTLKLLPQCRSDRKNAHGGFGQRSSRAALVVSHPLPLHPRGISGRWCFPMAVYGLVGAAGRVVATAYRAFREDPRLQTASIEDVHLKVVPTGNRREK